jgi:ketosteroid isomerase-like protein
MSTEQEVRHAAERFYLALNRALNGDAEPMRELWAHGPEATIQHPDGGRRVGWTEVSDGWQAWAQAVSAGRIEALELVVRLVTPDVAVVTAREQGEGKIGPETVQVSSRATLVLRREGREWKAVHHHVDSDPRIRALVEEAGAAVG